MRKTNNHSLQVLERIKLFRMTILIKEQHLIGICLKSMCVIRGGGVFCAHRDVKRGP